MRRIDVLGLLLLLSFLMTGGAQAEGNPNQFGGQDRSNAASEMIVLGVQQGISSLPPTSGQSFTYTFDPDMRTYVPCEQLGPTSFRSPQTVGAGRFSFRVATSYFELANTKAPIPYLAEQPPGTPFAVIGFGQQAHAKVGLLNLSMNYGLVNRFEVMLNLPVAIVNAQANEIFTSGQAAGAPNQAPVDGPPVLRDAMGNPDVKATVGLLNQALQTGRLHFA